VPSIGTGLISVTRMVDTGYHVEFEETTCYVSRHGMGKQLGSRNGSLYRLSLGTALAGWNSSADCRRNEAHLGLLTNQSPVATLDTCHRRLCHRTLDRSAVKYISERVTNMKVSSETNGSSKVCEVCTWGRQHREAETKTREKTQEVLGMVQSDICGPMETPSLNGERYFITFTDETTVRVSINLLHSKNEAVASFQAYCAWAEKASW